MYHIVKRIVRTIKTVTWSIRWEGDAMGERTIEEQVSWPTGSTITEEEVIEIKKLPKKRNQKTNSIQDQGVKT